MFSILAFSWSATNAACTAEDEAGAPSSSALVQEPAEPEAADHANGMASWGFGALGSGIGLTSIVSARNGAATELYRVNTYDGPICGNCHSPGLTGRGRRVHRSASVEVTHIDG